MSAVGPQPYPLPSSLRVRPAAARDRDAVLALAPRLVTGAAPWLDASNVLVAVQRSILDAIDGAGGDRIALIAEDTYGRCVGFVSVERHEHWSGVAEAYIGELIVAEDVEGTGVGRVLLAAAEAWAGERGYRRIALDTSAANARAQRVYAQAGFAEESVRLVKLLERDQ
jgi:aminoglycoside 6'-N-acetyltransferase I